jgi:excinuclease ABC subunit B
VTTLTKRMAEDLTDYLKDLKMNVAYIHSDVNTLERVEIINNLRKGIYDILVGVNLLREGLDIPECALVAILDADKEGFLRNKTSLIQTIGRAARNKESKVILYADKITKSIEVATQETDRRRKIQQDHNKKHNIIPKTTSKSFSSPLDSLYGNKKLVSDLILQDKYSTLLIEYKKGGIIVVDKKIESITKEMIGYISELKFEEAANCRDDIKDLEKIKLITDLTQN